MIAARSGDTATRKQITAVGRRLYERGLIAGAEGNVSARVGRGRMLITPAGVAKADLRPTDLVVIDERGQTVAGAGRPSTEIAMHLRIYKRRPDVGAVVHADPPLATAFAVAGETFESPVLPEVVLSLGPIALVRCATPGTEALADRLDPLLDGHDVFCSRTTERRP